MAVEDYEIESGNEAEKRRRQDRDDLNNEIAGRNTGRIRRFFPGQDGLSSGGGRGRAEKEADLMVLARQADPVWCKLYEEVGEKLDRAEQASLLALRDALRREEQARRELEELRERAARLADGRRVYRTGDGTAAYDEDGNRLSDDEFAGVAWNDSQPSWEEECKVTRNWNDAAAEVEEVKAYRSHVGEMRHRHAKGDLSQDELEQMGEELEADMPESVRRHYRADAAESPRPSEPARAQNEMPRTGSVASRIWNDHGALSAASPSAAFNTAAEGLLSPDELKQTAAIAPAIPAGPQLG